MLGVCTCNLTRGLWSYIGYWPLSSEICCNNPFLYPVTLIIQTLSLLIEFHQFLAWNRAYALIYFLGVGNCSETVLYIFCLWFIKRWDPIPSHSHVWGIPDLLVYQFIFWTQPRLLSVLGMGVSTLDLRHPLIKNTLVWYYTYL